MWSFSFLIPRTLAYRPLQLARYPILGLSAYLLVLFVAVIALVDTCTGGRLSQ